MKGSSFKLGVNNQLQSTLPFRCNRYTIKQCHRVSKVTALSLTSATRYQRTLPHDVIIQEIRRPQGARHIVAFGLPVRDKLQQSTPLERIRVLLGKLDRLFGLT